MCKLDTGTVNCVGCDISGLLVGVGSGPVVTLHDVRYDRTLLTLRSSYPEPVHSILFFTDQSKHILFANKKQIKITDSEGKFFTSV